MAEFVARVELDGNPTREQYEELHEAMDNIGFLKEVTNTRTADILKSFSVEVPMT